MDPTHSSPRGGSHPASLLLRSLLAGLCSAAVVLWFGNIYQSATKSIEISFTLHYDNQIKNHWQVFVKTGEKGKKGTWKSGSPTIFLKSDKPVSQKIVVPCDMLEEIRLDLGSNPGKVELCQLALQGQRRVDLQDMIQRKSNQISDLRLTDDGLTCYSSKTDPYVIFQLKEALPGTTRWDGWAVAILAVSTFLIAFAAARVLTCGKREPRGWLYAADSILVVLFLAALFLPMSNISKQEFSAGEKRKLAAYRPLMSSDGQVNYRFGRDFDAWFNDHFFGRSALLDLNASLFLMTKSPLQPYGMVYSGFDGWYFYSRNNALRNYHNLDLFSSANLIAAADDLNKIHAICRKKGKKLYVVIVPDKHKVYGEYFPGAPKVRPDSQSRSRQLEAYLRENTSVPVIHLLDTLLANKKQGALYWKNSTHWNEMGAYIGYLEIMKAVRKDFPDVPLCRVDRIKLEEPTVRGDLNSLSNGRRIPDNTLYPLPRFAAQYKITQNLIKPFHFQMMSNPNGRHKVLILRDSFAVSLLPYMGNSFHTITALWCSYRLPREKLQAFQDSDIVIFECVERLLPRLLDGIHATMVNLEQGVR